MAQRSRPGTAEAATKSFGGDQHIISDRGADGLDLATMPPNEWRAWVDGYRVGVDHGRQAADEAADARSNASFREAADLVLRATHWPVIDNKTIDSSSQVLTALALDREAAGIERFRADHAQRFAASGGTRETTPRDGGAE